MRRVHKSSLGYVRSPGLSLLRATNSVPFVHSQIELRSYSQPLQEARRPMGYPKIPAGHDNWEYGRQALLVASVTDIRLLGH